MQIIHSKKQSFFLKNKEKLCFFTFSLFCFRKIARSLSRDAIKHFIEIGCARKSAQLGNFKLRKIRAFQHIHGLFHALDRYIFPWGNAIELFENG